MINNSFLDQFKQLPNRLVATVHKDPDFDAVGSLLAFGELLEELGKKVTLYAPDLDMHQFKHLPNINKLSKSLATEYDVAFFLDCSDISRIYKPTEFASYDYGINIDHHQDNTLFCKKNLVINTSSVGEIVFNMYKQLNIPISKDAAINLYAAICFDTGNFKFSNTNVSTFKAAAELLDCGINASQISEWIFENKSMAYLDDVKEGLNHLYRHPKHPYLIVLIPYRINQSKESTINFFRECANTELVIVCKETAKNKFKLSFRSKQLVDVAAMAHKFNGGGHIRAAGAYMELPFNKLQDQLMQHANEVFE